MEFQRVWKAKHLREFAKNTDYEVKDVTARAFACVDDLAAVMTLTALVGVSVPAGSALLVAHDPDRFTIADTRAWASLTGHNYLVEFADAPWPRCWLAYLQTCRGIRPERMSLRDVDRALWAANGALGLPT
jgi:hypothetical protein